jgi:hypothetical protein
MTATGTVAQVSTLATHTALSAWTITDNFLIVIILLVALFIFAKYIGRGAFFALLISFYAAYAPYVIFPYTSFLPTTPASTSILAHAGLYAALVIIFFIILRRVIASDFLYIGNVELIILSFLGAGFLIALASHVFLISSVYQFTPAISALFSPDKYFFWWFSAPAVGFLFLAR